PAPRPPRPPHSRPRVPRCGGESAGAVLAKAREAANDGRLEEARAWCERAIAADKMDPVHHYLLAIVEREMGDEDAARRSLGRALYLDPRFALAHFVLGHLDLSAGRRADAARSLTNALGSLRDYGDEDAPPESEGLTAGRLREIVGSLLATLSDERRLAGGRR
ncbi:MAG: hypothetical protein ACRD2J_08360, partial [Thermoanaerobaculia bacterium]